MIDALNWFAGKKTYIVAFAAATLGLVQAVYPEFVVPGWAEYVLGALGLGAMRAAIK